MLINITTLKRYTYSSINVFINIKVATRFFQIFCRFVKFLSGFKKNAFLGLFFAKVKFKVKIYINQYKNIKKKPEASLKVFKKKFDDDKKIYLHDKFKVFKIPGFSRLFKDFVQNFSFSGFCLKCQIPGFSRFRGKVTTM